MAALSGIIGYGLASARPTAGVPGRLYYASDTHALSRDNGVSWDALTLSAVAGSGSLILIEEWRPSDGTQSHDFTIPGTVAEVEWEISGRGKEAVQSAEVGARFNADTGSNYGNAAVFNYSGGDGGGGGLNDPTTQASLGNLPGTSATSTRQGRIKGSVSRVQEAIEHTWFSEAYRHTSETVTDNLTSAGGHHTGTSAITTLTIRTTSANGFAVGTVVRVFGRLT